MPRRRTDPRFFLLASTFAAVVFLVAASSLRPPTANAGPLDAVTVPVNEITAPVQQAVEQVVPPVTAPPPSQAPPAVELPEVEVPVAVPTTPEVVEKATNTVAAATGAANGGAGTAVSTGQAAAADAQGAAAEVSEAAQSTITSATATAETALNAPSAAAAAALGVGRDASGAAPASRPTAESGAAPREDAGATTAPLDNPTMVFPSLPARVLDPFIRVWPAVALLAEGPLGSFVRDWSRSTLELFAASRTGGGGSPDSAARPLAEPSPAAAPPLGQQPPFSSFAPPALTPFNWVAGESALLGLALFLVLGASTLAILVLGRRELGLPMFRRGNRFPWRH